MDTYEICEKKYYLVNEIMLRYGKKFQKYKNEIEFVLENDVPDDKYIFANEIGKKMNAIYISKKWFDDKIVGEVLDDNETDKNLNAICISKKLFDDEIIGEKFVNDVINIETIGEQDYFKVSDIMTSFNIKSLNNTVTNQNNGYIVDEHYKYFFDNQKIELYLTYSGLLRVFFILRKETTARFTNWATGTLFTKQKGTSVNVQFNKTEMPVIYLFTLGSAKDLRQIFDISEKYEDDCVIAKFGATNDFEYMVEEYEKECAILKNVKIELVCYNYIYPRYLSHVESYLKELLYGFGLTLKHEKYEELLILDRNQYLTVKKQYERVGRKYNGYRMGLINKIKNLENEIKLMKIQHEIEIADLVNFHK